MIWLASTTAPTVTVANEHASRIPLKSLPSLNCPWVTNKHYPICNAPTKHPKIVCKALRKWKFNLLCESVDRTIRYINRCLIWAQRTCCFYVQIDFMNLHVKGIITNQWKQRISTFTMRGSIHFSCIWFCTHDLAELTEPENCFNHLYSSVLAKFTSGYSNKSL